MDRPENGITHPLQQSDTQELHSAAQVEGVEDLVVPVLKEELEVHKERRKTGTVRVSKTVRELEEVINESLTSETADVQRIPMDLVVDIPPQIRTEGDVTIIPIIKEELVIIKQLRIVEELRVTKRQSVTEHRENVTVRVEEVTVERVNEGLKVATSKAQG